jgi:hypothetical protein
MTTALEAVQEGSRWLHARPSSEEVVAWFERQRLHKGMEHAPYVSGVVVINSTEKVKRTVTGDNGRQYVDEIEQAVFTPYVKVDTRVSYFWDYVHVLNDSAPDGVEYVGAIEPAEVPVIEDPQSPWFNAYLPSGFHFTAQRHRQGDAVVRYVCFTSEVSIVRYDERGEQATVRTVLRGRGTKMVPTVARNGYADDFSLMKAETGSVGRALGMAGILVIGTGVATAEDVQEAISQPTSPGSERTGPVLPDVVPPPALPVDAASRPERPIPGENVAEQPQPQARSDDSAVPSWDEMTDEERLVYAKSLATAHREEFPAEYQAVFMPWWKDREFGKIDELQPDELQSAVIKLERDLDALRASKR